MTKKKALTKTMVTQAVEAGVPDGKAHLMLWDGTVAGFGLKLRPSGAASWIFTYRPKGAVRGTTSRTLTIGAWPALSVDKARDIARGHAGSIALGSDPAADLRASRLRERALLSVALADYEADLTRRRFVNRATVISTLRRGFAPMLNEEVASLDRRALVERIEAIATTPRKRKDGTVYQTPGAALDFRKGARTFLEWAVQRGLTPYNVLAGYRAAKASRAEMLEGEGRAGRALDDAEIKAVWQAAGGMGAFGGLVRLALLTGLRRSELAALTWNDVGEDRIVIPAKRAKMGRVHEVPITSAMRAVLVAQARTTSPLVFPSRKTGGEMDGWSKLLPRLRKGSGIDFRLHDLRRTCRTLMSRRRISEEVAELAIGHVRTGLVGTYNKDTAWPDRVQAFEAVSDHVSHTVCEGSGPAGDGVLVPFNRKASGAGGGDGQ